VVITAETGKAELAGIGKGKERDKKGIGFSERLPLTPRFAKPPLAIE